MNSNYIKCAWFILLICLINVGGITNCTNPGGRSMWIQLLWSFHKVGQGLTVYFKMLMWLCFFFNQFCPVIFLCFQITAHILYNVHCVVYELLWCQKYEWHLPILPSAPQFCHVHGGLKQGCRALGSETDTICVKKKWPSEQTCSVIARLFDSSVQSLMLSLALLFCSETFLHVISFHTFCTHFRTIATTLYNHSRPVL